MSKTMLKHLKKKKNT